MTYQLSTGSLILDYQLNLYSTPLTSSDIASYFAGGLKDVNTFQNFAARGFLPREQGELFSKTTGRYYFGPLVHFTSAAEATFRIAEGDYSGAAISLAANEGGYLAGNLAASRATKFLLPYLETIGLGEGLAGVGSVAAGFLGGGLVTYGIGTLGLAAAETVASWNPGVSPAPQMLRGADGRLYFVGNDAVFGGSGKLISGGVTPVYGIVDGLTSFRNFSPNLSDIPVIDNGPAPNGYDKPWGSASGAWGQSASSASITFNRAGASGAASGVSFLNDGPAAPSSRSGAGTGVFGNDFGDANLPGRGNVSYAIACAA